MSRAGVTYERALGEASRLADDEGFDAVTVSAVARRLGVRPASMYAHLRDRAELIDGLHRLALSTLGDRIAEAIAGRAGRDALAGLADAHRTLAQDRPGLWAALQRPASDRTAASDEARRVATMIAAVLRGYQIPEAELVHAIRLVAATTAGFVNLVAAEAFSRRDDPIQLSWDRALNALDRSLTTWPEA